MTDKSQYHRDEIAQQIGYDDYDSFEYNAKFWGEEPDDYFYMLISKRFDELNDIHNKIKQSL